MNTYNISRIISLICFAFLDLKMSKRESDSAFQVANNVLTAPLDVVRGATHGAVGGAKSMSDPLTNFVRDDNNNPALRVAAVPVAVVGGVVGGAVGGTVGVVTGTAKGVGRVLTSIFK